MITLEQLKDIHTRVADLARYLDIDSKKIQVEEEELRTHVADFWDDRKRAEAQMKKIKDLHFWLDSYKEVSSQAEELQLAFDFLKEGLVEEADIDAQYARVLDLIEHDFIVVEVGKGFHPGFLRLQRVAVDLHRRGHPGVNVNLLFCLLHHKPLISVRFPAEERYFSPAGSLALQITILSYHITAVFARVDRWD